MSEKRSLVRILAIFAPLCVFGLAFQKGTASEGRCINPSVLHERMAKLMRRNHTLFCGPNCMNTVLTLFGITPSRYTSTAEYRYFEARDFEFVQTITKHDGRFDTHPIRFGHILRMDGYDHVAVYIGHGNVFHKLGYKNFPPFEIVSINESPYFREQYKIKVYRFRKISRVEPTDPPAVEKVGMYLELARLLTHQYQLREPSMQVMREDYLGAADALFRMLRPFFYELQSAIQFDRLSTLETKYGSKFIEELLTFASYYEWYPGMFDFKYLPSRHVTFESALRRTRTDRMVLKDNPVSHKIILTILKHRFSNTFSTKEQFKIVEHVMNELLIRNQSNEDRRAPRQSLNVIEITIAHAEKVREQKKKQAAQTEDVRLYDQPLHSSTH